MAKTLDQPELQAVDLREDLLLRQGNSPPKLGGVAARIKDSQNRAQTGRSVQLPPRNRCASRKSVRTLRGVEHTAPPLRGTPPNLGGEFPQLSSPSTFPILDSCGL